MNLNGKAKIEDVIEELVRTGSVSVRGFGVFELKTTPPREWYIPKTGETRHLPERRTVRFRPAQSFRNKLNE